ncbi:hypothetical protein TNIN_154611 [Trichonephila inaurata madagascariensis]|uniref:Uncharacterized protein n=1 Tax=Trichonephila inaurata madagascariensis TaxID=2747483 RepID=A0A8X7CQR3_9ARAC|nr:hypothetical protein TNIN_154611 [Trichonephila inaurata madagascariensis]
MQTLFDFVSSEDICPDRNGHRAYRMIRLSITVCDDNIYNYQFLINPENQSLFLLKIPPPIKFTVVAESATAENPAELEQITLCFQN